MIEVVLTPSEWVLRRLIGLISHGGRLGRETFELLRPAARVTP
jgi:hypothetical protein